MTPHTEVLHTPTTFDGWPLPRVDSGDGEFGVQLRLPDVEWGPTVDPQSRSDAWYAQYEVDWRQRTAGRSGMAKNQLRPECEYALATYCPSDPRLASVWRRYREFIVGAVRATGTENPRVACEMALALTRYLAHHRVTGPSPGVITPDGIVQSLSSVRHSRNVARRTQDLLFEIGAAANPDFPPVVPQIPAGPLTPPCDAATATRLLVALEALPGQLRRNSALVLFHGSRGAALLAPVFRDLRGSHVARREGVVTVELATKAQPRLVVVADDHADALEDLARRSGDGYMVSPNRDGAGGKNLVNNTLGDVNGMLPRGLHLDLIAQRHAYIAAHLAHGTPLPVLTRMCGGIGSKTLLQLALVAPVDADEILLRGGLERGVL